jgi:hypothetical protein
MVQVQDGHISAANRMVVFQGGGHSDEVVSHRDDREKEQKQERDRGDCAPREPSVAKPDCSRPHKDDKKRDRDPQEIEEKLHVKNKYRAVCYFAGPQVPKTKQQRAFDVRSKALCCNRKCGSATSREDGEDRPCHRRI